MYHVSARGVDERMINVHYYYYYSCMVYSERAETAALSCGTIHASAKSTPLEWIYKKRYKKLVTHVTSARERRIALYKSDQQH